MKILIVNRKTFCVIFQNDSVQRRKIKSVIEEYFVNKKQKTSI